MKEQIVSIVFGMMFILIIDLISAENSNKKYINTACTFILVTSIISPVTEIWGDFSIDIDNAINYIDEFDVHSYEQSGFNIYDDMLNKEFENKLIDSFFLLIEQTDITFEGKVKFDYEKNTSSSDFGRINKIIISYTLLSESDKADLVKSVSENYKLSIDNVLIQSL